MVSRYLIYPKNLIIITTMDIVRSSVASLYSLISTMTATHYPDPSSKRALRRARRTNNLRRVAYGSIALGFVAGVVAVETPDSNGLFHRLGFSTEGPVNFDTDESYSGLRWTTGFYEFDDGPEEEIRKGRMSRADMASTTSPHFAAEYYQDPDLAASRGFFGLYASFQLGERGLGNRQDRSSRSLFAELADNAPSFGRPNRIRTRRDGPEDSGEGLKIFAKLFGNLGAAHVTETPEETKTSPEPSQKTFKKSANPDSEGANVGSGKKGPKVLKWLFGGGKAKRSVQPGDDI